MSHKSSYLITRGGSLVYNRRVPKHAQDAFGCSFVRVSLGNNEGRARAIAESLTRKLDQIWASPSLKPVDVAALVAVAAPRVTTLSDARDRYLDERGRGKGQHFNKVSRLACDVLTRVAGDRDIATYNREDARAFVQHLAASGAKSGTIRRRLNSIKALMEYAYLEDGIEKRNPFARLQIPGEGSDRTKRGTFTSDQLRQAYETALGSDSEIKLLVPLLGETGCRLAEIVGLRLSDVDVEEGLIRIVPHPARRLKTRGSERVLPLVGAALEAMTILAAKRRKYGKLSDCLFPRYERDGLIMATHASNAVNKWLKRDFAGLTAHSLRHTMRDRLRAVEAPLDLIDQIGGWASVGSVGAAYGLGYDVGALRRWLEKTAIEVPRSTPRGGQPVFREEAFGARGRSDQWPP